MSLYVAGVGTAVPTHTLSQEEAAELHASFCEMSPERSRTLRALYRRSGIRRRHMTVLDVSDGPLPTRQTFYPPICGPADRGPGTAERMAVYERDAPPLAVDSARRALTSAGLQPDDVTHLVTVSCTGFTAPGIDTRVIEALGLSRSTRRTHVGFMGCHGALNGLRVARSFLEADPRATVIVCAVELCSLHFAYGWDAEMLVPNALFSDGAATLVARHADRSEASAWRIAAEGSWLIPDTHEDMSWRIGDHGFRMTLSPRVPGLISDRLGAWLSTWLAEHGLALQDVASWAVHPGGPRILGAVEKAVAMGRDRTRVSREVLAEHGNMSSATLLFILDRLRSGEAQLPCVALAFGPGLVVEAALVV